jgi:uncharacterized cupin superfamily protein
MPKIDLKTVHERKGSTYPAPFNELAKDRIKQAVGDAGGLSDFGVNLVQLPPGAWSSQRHWHSHEDEFVYVISGQLTLITDDGEAILRPGDCATFAKNVTNGHHLVNRSTEMAVYLEVGTRTREGTCTYPDIDLLIDKSRGAQYLHKDGTPYSR